jgi:hypothetical protein
MRLGVLITAFAVLTVAAFADRTHTRRISSRASADSWWCTHRDIRCTGFDETAHYARWQKRELGYEGAFTVLGAAILFVGGRRLRVRCS